MLRPYGLTGTYPSQGGEGAWIPAKAGMTGYARVSLRGNDGMGVMSMSSAGGEAG